jgi:hypothetical protein
MPLIQFQFSATGLLENIAFSQIGVCVWGGAEMRYFDQFSTFVDDYKCIKKSKNHGLVYISDDFLLN